MDTQWIDQPGATRSGDEIDAQKLAAYLSVALPEIDEPLVVRQFPGGHSNLTYLLEAASREYVLRRPPPGVKIKSAHDMSREHRILSRLADVYPRVPRALLYCEDDSIIGTPFYIMQRMRGVILRAKPPQGLTLTADVMRGLSEATIDNLAQIHALDYAAAGLGDLGKPEGYAQRQIEGWTGRYHKAKTDDVPAAGKVMAWLADNIPSQSSAALIHNDYKYDNLVLNPDDMTDIIAVLDWEMATLGDPLMDLGSTLSYWLDRDDPPEMQLLRELVGGLTILPGNLGRRELLHRYAQHSGRDVGDGVFYYVYGLFKTAVIVQQLYYRYQQGLSSDKRLATLNQVAQLLCHVGTRAIDKGRIDGLGD